LRELDYYSRFMIQNKIKSLTTGYLIRHFRGKLNCQQNIQFLLFGQWIPKGGFRANGGSSFAEQAAQYKSMKTEDLEDARKEEKERLDDTM